MEKDQNIAEKQTVDLNPVNQQTSHIAKKPASKTIDPLEYAAIPPQEQNDRQRAFVSSGEHIHKWGSYLSVDWIYNATAGALFAYWGKFTPSGKALWSKPVDKAFDTALRPFIKNPEKLKWSVSQGNTFMSIIAGGMLTIPPLLVLENKDIKLSITKTLDSMIYGKDKVENDPKFQQAYDEIENAPKKDFWTGMTSRFAALAPLLASVLFPPTGNWLKKNLFNPVGAQSKAIVSRMGLPAAKLFKKFPAAERQARWNYVHDDAIAMDLSFGLPYAVLHAYFYNMFASHKEKGNLEHTQAHAVSEATLPSSEQPQAPDLGVPKEIAQHTQLTKTAKQSEQSFTDYVSSNTPSSLQMGAA